MKPLSTQRFATEAEMVTAFCAQIERRQRDRWTIYHETAGFDLLLVEDKTGIQLGLEAKLSLNLKVLTQALPSYDWHQDEGPDYRGALVPSGKVQGDLSEIARRLGLGVLTIMPERSVWQSFSLPDEQHISRNDSWYPWLPTRRCQLPEYIPDVTGGHPAPVQLTHWKIQAIKLLILLDRRGFVTRADIKALGLSQPRWTQPGGYLAPENGVYVRWKQTPDFQVQHPTNWGQIEADFEKWAPAPQARQTLLAVPA